MKNDLSDYLKVSVRGNSVVLNVKCSNHTICFIGSNFDSVVLPGSEYLSSISLNVESGRDGVIFISIKFQHDDYNTSAQYSIPICWEDGKLRVRLDEIFISDKIMIQVDGHNNLIVGVEMKEKFIALHEPDEKKMTKFRGLGYQIIGDPNLLCRFVMNEISIDLLREASGSDPRSAMQLELSELQSRIIEIDNKLTEKETIHRRFVEATNNDLDFKMKKIAELREEIGLLNIRESILIIFLKDVIRELKNGWWSGKIVKGIKNALRFVEDSGKFQACFEKK